MFLYTLDKKDYTFYQNILEEVSLIIGNYAASVA